MFVNHIDWEIIFGMSFEIFTENLEVVLKNMFKNSFINSLINLI